MFCLLVHVHQHLNCSIINITVNTQCVVCIRPLLCSFKVIIIFILRIVNNIYCYLYIFSENVTPLFKI